MEQLNLPRHVVERFEKRWARKLQQQVSAWRTRRSPARSQTDSASRSSADHADRGLLPSPVACREPSRGRP